MRKIFTALQIIFQDPFYWAIAISSSVIVAYVSYWLFYQTTTITTYIGSIQNGDFGRYSLLYGSTYLATTVAIIILSGISITTTVWLFRHSKFGLRKNIGANVGGLLASAFAMGCPVCGAFLLSAIGIAGGLTIFPFKGLELKFLSLALLGGATIYGLLKIRASDCNDCQDISQHKKEIKVEEKQHSESKKRLIVITPQHIVVTTLIGLFLLNNTLIGQVAGMLGMAPSTNILALLGIREKPSYTIIAPKINSDGKTTSLVEQPTISEVPGNPNTGNYIADAKVVMFPHGKPFYAPSNISFDDPINAQKKWGAYENSITLSGDLQKRYDTLINSFTCNYCCGGPTSVTVISRCGCQHAKAWRGFFKYMLQTYGNKYSNDQLKGEAYRWTGIWYPKGVLEDYLLATGHTNALPHETHGGAGLDGMHGIKRK